MATAAALSVRISANTSDFDKSLKSLEKSFGSWGTKLTSIGDKLTTGITLPLAGVAIAATKFASDFEKSTTKLVTLSGVSEKQMQEMKRAVLDLAPAVGIGPNKLAEALLVVTSTGFQGAAAMTVLELAAKGSAIGMGDTKDVARALTAAVSAYGAENLTAATAADVLHATVVAGGAEAAELAGEMGRVVGVAASLGVSFQEVGAFIATYTRLGLSAAEATTGLSGVLNTVLNPSKEARDALAGMGISAQGLRDAIANKGLGATLTELIARLHGNADATGALFGNVRALAGVMGTAGTQAAAYKSNLDAIQGSNGGLNRAFEATKKTFAFMWDQFKASAEKAAITLGVQLLPAAVSILQAMKPIADLVVRMIVLFSQLPQPVQLTVIGFLGLLAALGPILSVAGRVSTALGALASAGRLAGSSLALTFGTTAVTVSAGTVAGVLGLAAGFAFLAVKIREASKEFGFWVANKAALSATFASGAIPFLGPMIAGAMGGGRPSADLLGAPRSRGKGDVYLPPETKGGPNADVLKALGMSKADWDKLFGAGGVGGDDKGLKKKADEWKSFMDTISGRDNIKDAEKWTKGVAELGGVTKLTAEQQERMNKALLEAFAAYKALGLAVPLNELQRFTELQKAQFITTSKTLSPETLASAQKLFELQSMPGARTAGLGGFAADGPQLMLPPVPGLTQTLSPETLAQVKPGPSWLSKIFGGSKDFGANLSNTIMGALQGGGGIGKSLGGMLGGGALSGIAGKAMGALGSKGLGGMLGGVLGSVLPGLGNILGALGGNAISGLFGKLFGGEKKKTNQARDAYIEQAGGITELKKAAEEAGFSLDKMLSTKKVKDFQSEVGKLDLAVKAHKDLLESIGNLTAGVNARAANVSTQGDLDVVGAGALAAFALQIQQGTGALEAYQSITPAITAMNTAMAVGNMTVSESVAKLMGLGLILDQNNIQFTNLGASGQILQAMLQGNIRDGALFAAVATDIGTQIQTVIDRGVPMAQVFALAQPQLQALWEAQQKWGFAVDETTGHLLAEAEAQGFVGAAMKTVNQQILDVLVAIGKVLGADIPAALSGLPAAAQAAADGMNAAFGGVKLPGGYQEPQGTEALEGAYVPRQAARGGIVRARSGGTLVNVGEGGRDEVIMPLGSSGLKGSSNGSMTVIIERDGQKDAEFIVPYLPGAVRRYVAG
jgi:TP901 family phage tail tape measure protein